MSLWAIGRTPTLPQLLRAAAHGIPGVAGAGGVYACPSRKEEFGLALLEALAAGLSVVGPDRGGPPTYVEDGRQASSSTPPISSRCGPVSARAASVQARSSPRGASPLARAGALHRRRDGRPAVSLYTHVTGEAAASGRMTALLVSPDYISHYLPLSAVGAGASRRGSRGDVRDRRRLRERVLADGFGHVELRLGAGSNATPETDADDQSTADFLAVTREGMVATLEHQARRGSTTCSGIPSASRRRLEEIVDDVRPELVLSDQLAFGASLALPRARHPLHVVPPGTSVPAAAARAYRSATRPRRPAGFAEQQELAALHALCDRRRPRVHAAVQRDAARAGAGRATGGETPSQRSRPAGTLSTIPAAWPDPALRPE